MITELKQHNYDAWLRVIKAFRHERMACVVHPTGTGKSYIVAAVAEGYEHVLIVAPNNFVLRQQREVLGWHKGASYTTYQWLHRQDRDIKQRYDLIVLDEFHRAGAPEWQTAVTHLLDTQPQAKVLGTSATPVRYLDGGRDMVSELFGGHTTSTMSIAEAWHKNILPIPHYVTAFFNFDRIVADAEQRIRDNKRINPEDRRGRIRRLSNARLDWQRSLGMPDILRRHLPTDLHRVIVFCPHIEMVERMRNDVARWFFDAGFPVKGTHVLHSEMSESGQTRAIRAFERNDHKGGVRLMFCVNMLNEGVHIPQVGAVLMLRTTSSHIIYTQQMGRALTAASTDRPVVLDMVDNITTTSIIPAIREEFEQLEREAAERDGRQPRSFEVVDYTLSVTQMIERLTGFSAEYTEHIALIRRWVDSNGRFPYKRNRNNPYEARLGERWLYVKKRYPGHPEVAELIADEKQLRHESLVRDTQTVDNFCTLRNRIPHQSKDGEANRALQRLKVADRAAYDRLKERYGHTAKKMREVLALARDYIDAHGHLPKQTGSTADKNIAKRWLNLQRKHPGDPRILSLIEYANTLNP